MDVFTQFHFLRPLWLLALLLVPLLWWYSQKTQIFSGSDWSKAIQPELLKHLMVGKNAASTSNNWAWIFISIVFIVLGLSGPSWQKKPEPLHQQSDNLAVVLDLSLSMLASDQKPNRLTRAKHKLRDLLEQRKEGTTALIVYSGDSYVVTPLTDDINTLKSMLPALDPFIMPVMGSRPDLAIEKAIDVLKNGGATQGKILLITDGIEEENLSSIKTLLKPTNYPLSVLAVGTEEGGPISIPQQGYLKDKGSVIIPKTDFDLLSQLASENNGIMETISLSDSDINNLKAVTDASSIPTEEKTDNNGLYDQWHDEGYWLALLLLPLVLIGHRKGAFSLVLLLAVTFQPNEAMAFGWEDLWLTSDQQAMELVNKEPEKAAELFQNNQWKGTAQYKSKNFEGAQQSFDSGTTTTDLYNGATALAQQKKFEEALAAYDKVLKKDPEFKDAALNKALIEKFMEEQENQDQQSQDQSSDDSDSDSDSDQSKSDESKQEQSDSNDSQDSQNNQQPENQEPTDQQQNSDQQNPSEQGDSEQSEQQDQAEQSDQDNNQEKQDQQEQQTSASEQSEQDAQARDKEQQAQAKEADELTDEETQAFEQWMRRVPDDPGGLLRRKFAQQYQQKQYENKRRPQRQEEGQPIW